jgi:hypothetical protein
VPISVFRKQHRQECLCHTSRVARRYLAAVKPSGGGGILAVERSVPRVYLRTLT